MADFILPSKLVPEQVTVRFDFLDELDWGDTISTAEVECTVYIGIDPDPEFVLREDIQVFSTYILQKVRQGVPGVFYKLVCRATTINGQILDKETILAILPSQAIIPDLFGTPYTSLPYPISSFDHITSDVVWFSGTTDAIVEISTIDSITSTSLWLSGLVDEGAVYRYFDHVTSSVNWISGIFENSVFYQARKDDVTSGAQWSIGVIEVAVSYDARKDDITPSVVWLSGSSP